MSKRDDVAQRDEPQISALLAVVWLILINVFFYVGFLRRFGGELLRLLGAAK